MWRWLFASNLQVPVYAGGWNLMLRYGHPPVPAARSQSGLCFMTALPAHTAIETQPPHASTHEALEVWAIDAKQGALESTILFHSQRPHCDVNACLASKVSKPLQQTKRQQQTHTHTHVNLRKYWKRISHSLIEGIWHLDGGKYIFQICAFRLNSPSPAMYT